MKKTRFQATISALSMLIWMGISINANAQRLTRKPSEVALYKAAINAVFTDETIIANAYYKGSKPHRKDFFVLVPSDVKEALSFGKRLDNYVVDSVRLYQALRQSRPAHLVILSFQQVPAIIQTRFGVHFGIGAIIKLDRNNIERRVVPAPILVQDENYFLGFEVVEEDNGDITVKRYPLPYMPPQSK
jgi:hypothetical protein